jgi:hypothetical protein
MQSILQRRIVPMIVFDNQVRRLVTHPFGCDRVTFP